MSAKELTSKSAARAIDEPLREPASDLLEMDRHAKALADYIKERRKLPFTVGIFGEWGEGKTTMVNFIKHHLTPDPIDGKRAPFYFVHFSAWPYTTSEKLWRALILEIAKTLYDVDTEALEQKRQQASRAATQSNNARPSFITRIADFLHNDLSRTKTEPEELSEFDKLVKELDRAGYGKISKRTPSAAMDQEEVMTAVVNGALSVLGTVSPLVGGIRSIFTWPGNAEQSDAEEEPSSEELEALPRFQQLFRDILKKADPHRVYVFIDDLDRAQPDVALDIMESIRIALSDGDCVYILAVDERLIAQGLRLRYRELFAKEEDAAIASKGQEYLEKIIQFRTRVPPRTAEQTQRLIAAEFPHWTPAGDIIQSIVGNNPRRVKQYCQRLGFQNMIGATSFTLGSDAAEETVPERPHISERESSLSEVITLSRTLRDSPHFREPEVRDLFVQLGENYSTYAGDDAAQRLETLLVNYNRNGKLEEVKEALDAIKPGLLPPRNKRP